jgi:site-specific DNA-methyltransferase (adenine-specific)
VGLPKPYYQKDGIVIYHADCRDVLPYLPKVDLVLTDPQYGIGRDSNPPTTSRHGGRKGYEGSGWDDARPRGSTFDALRLCSSGQVIWGGNYFADYLPPTSGWLVWDKGQRIAQSDGELAWTSQDRALRIFTLNRVALMQDNASHPTQKPLKLMTWCLSLFPDAKTVGDPFLGSGTTLVAAKLRGLTGWGVEREEKYAEIAAKRLAQDYLDFGSDNA